MYTNIIHATDLNESNFHICEKAVKIAERLNAKLYIIHVIEVPAGVQLAQSLGFTELVNPSNQDAWTVMNLLGEAVGIPADRQLVERGAISDVIIKKAQELECDLILVGTHGSEGLQGLIGNTTSHLVLHAPCDVITLKDI